jgi:hypothetical protein
MKSLLVIFGTIELMLRVIVMVVMIVSVIGLFFFTLSADFETQPFMDLLTPYLWTKL